MLLRSIVICSFLLFFTSLSNGSTSLQVNRLVLATHIENKEPQNIKSNFETDDKKVVAFAEFSTSSPETVTFIWYYDDHVYLKWPTQISASPRFRTYSRVTAHPGKWRVQIQDNNGSILKEENFEVKDRESISQGRSFQKSKTASSEVKNEDQSRPKGFKEALSSLSPEKDEFNNDLESEKVNSSPKDSEH